MITADVPTGPIRVEGLKEPSETMLAVPFLIPRHNASHLSRGSLTLSNRIVGSAFALFNPSSMEVHAKSSSNSDRGLVGGTMSKSSTLPLIARAAPTGRTEIGKMKFVGNESTVSF